MGFVGGGGRVGGGDWVEGLELWLWLCGLDINIDIYIHIYIGRDTDVGAIIGRIKVSGDLGRRGVGGGGSLSGG